MNHINILIVFSIYTILLFLVGWLTSRKANNNSFFIGEKKSPWYIVAYGMISASLSGVTFISIPGVVGTEGFSYMVIVFGYLIGYFVIARILIPIYYSFNVTSIYSYLNIRFGMLSYKAGASFFLLSRIIGASFRMFLVINILQIFVFNQMGVPFWVTVIGFVGLILAYTYQGGIKTIVWTDTLQTTFMLLAVGISIFLISKESGLSVLDLYKTIDAEGLTKMFVTNTKDSSHYLKQFFSGVFIAIVMTGLDQDMMQKNLSCRNKKDAQKNIISLSWALVPVNFIFLSLGGFLFYFAQTNGIQINGTSDMLFPTIALNHLGVAAGTIFIIGLIAAAYSSADSALTSLTTSFSIDLLGIERRDNLNESEKIKTRKLVHLLMALVLVLVIATYELINDQAIITKLFTIAGYTYGPLLGLFSFGLISKRKIKDKYAPYIALAAPTLAYLIKLWAYNSYQYEIGFELLIYNGLLMYLGLLMISNKNK